MDDGMAKVLADAYHKDQVVQDRGGALQVLGKWVGEADGRRDQLQARLTELRAPAYAAVLRRDHIGRVQAALLEALFAE